MTEIKDTYIHTCVAIFDQMTSACVPWPLVRRCNFSPQSKISVVSQAAETQAIQSTAKRFGSQRLSRQTHGPSGRLSMVMARFNLGCDLGNADLALSALHRSSRVSSFKPVQVVGLNSCMVLIGLENCVGSVGVCSSCVEPRTRGFEGHRKTKLKKHDPDVRPVGSEPLQDQDDQTPLQAAHFQHETIRVLVDAGAKVNASDPPLQA